jgi:hypothetical protein
MSLLSLNDNQQRRRRKLGLTLKLLCVASLQAGLAHAAEWSVRGNVYQLLGYDDNVFMRSNDRDSVGAFQYRIIPTINFKHQTDASEINAHASYGTQVYPDIPQFDQNIQNYGVDGTYNTTRIDWGLNFNYSITPTRYNAVQDSGDFLTSADKDTWTISPTMAVKLTALDSLVFRPSYSESSFVRTAGVRSGQNIDNFNSYQDNNTKTIDIGWSRLWTEKYNSDLSVYYSQYEFTRTSDREASDSSSIGRNNESYGINFANNYLLNENWSLSGSVGFRHTVSGAFQNNPELANDGFLANMNADYKGENYGANLGFFRSLMPSNLGQLQESTGTTLHFFYKFNERLSAQLDTSYLNSSFINAGQSNDRDNITVHPAVNWMLDKDWTLTAAYRFRTQDRTGAFDALNQTSTQSSSADSNFFIFSVNYNWPGLKVSR